MAKKQKRQTQNWILCHHRMILLIRHRHASSKVRKKVGLIVRRQQYPDLLVAEEIIPISEDQSCCPECEEAYLPFSKTENSEIIEIHAAVHVRKIKREQAKAGCHYPKVGQFCMIINIRFWS